MPHTHSQVVLYLHMLSLLLLLLLRHSYCAVDFDLAWLGFPPWLWWRLLTPLCGEVLLATVEGWRGEERGEAGAPEQQVFVGIFKHLTRTKGNWWKCRVRCLNSSGLSLSLILPFFFFSPRGRCQGGVEAGTPHWLCTIVNKAKQQAATTTTNVLHCSYAV